MDTLSSLQWTINEHALCPRGRYRISQGCSPQKHSWKDSGTKQPVPVLGRHQKCSRATESPSNNHTLVTLWMNSPLTAACSSSLSASCNSSSASTLYSVVRDCKIHKKRNTLCSPRHPKCLAQAGTRSVFAESV